MVLRIPAYRIDAGHFAVESAFAAHLRLLRDKLGGSWADLIVAAPTFDAADYHRLQTQLAVIDESAERIRFVGLFPANLGKFGFFMRLPSVWMELWRQVKRASVVHASTSDLFRPFEFPALAFGSLQGKKTICLTDIDNRRSAEMKYKTGRWNWRQYWTTRLLHGSFTHLQHKLAVRAFSQTLLKGVCFANDYGNGRETVKFFLDSAFSQSDIISPSRLAQKLSRLTETANPVRLVYFGRLVDYKGVDHMLRAIAQAKVNGLANFKFQIIGDGEAREALEQLTNTLSLRDQVTFTGAVKFGPDLFERLYDCDLLLAAPLAEDTPRSALDAMASGQAVLAYDTYYYRDLKTLSGALEVVPWRDEAALTQRITALCVDRSRLANLIVHGVEFAKSNTQEIWLDRRLAWTRELLVDKKST